ncbi:vomeronasal type-1 receptor 2-like [Tenrec ecaudatus]|uniref:vomeronasal type-1 receptor 2-like n=1 Tax=Tenrec ecaudatus TaxID=94439 RepID=UPI003F5ABAEE
MGASELKGLLNDTACKLLSYIHKVGRAVSMGSTCLLSVFQVITISPRNSRWADFKQKTLKHMGLCSNLCWVLHMFILAIIPMYTSIHSNNKTTTKNKFGYCNFAPTDSKIFALFLALISSHDVLCLGVMSWASGTMVSILYRHKQRVRHMYSNNLSHRSSPETRASQSIIVLVSTFVVSYAISCAMGTYFSRFANPRQWLVKMYAFITVCFPALSPFLLMSSDTRVLKPCSLC